MRAFSSGGFADINQLHAWNMDFVRNTAEGSKYRELASKIEDTLRFMDVSAVAEYHVLEGTKRVEAGALPSLFFFSAAVLSCHLSVDSCCLVNRRPSLLRRTSNVVLHSRKILYR